MDNADKRLLRAIQVSAELSNAAIGEVIGLSASQVSRRRQKLEEQGVIAGYRAVLKPSALGYTLDAIIRIKLTSHTEQSAKQFRLFIQELPEIRLACASGLINKRLLPLDMVAEVRSDVVLDLIKDDSALEIV